MNLSSSRVVNIADLRSIAERRVPKVVFDYLDGGADGEVTLRENCRAFESVLFRPRQAVAFPEVNLRARVLGHELSVPFMLAPVGYSRMMHPGGEVVAARAAGICCRKFRLFRRFFRARDGCSRSCWTVACQTSRTLLSQGKGRCL